MERLSQKQKVAGLLLVALLLRVGILIVQQEHLADDRDAYLSIAQNLVAGNGYSDPTVDWPTQAFRPPMYPILLAGLLSLGGGTAAIGLLHLLLGTATVYLTWLISQRLQLGSLGYLAAGIVAIDPLLLNYTTFPMTETTCAFLTTLLLYILVSNSEKKWTPQESVVFGVVFGLSVLCRPTIWAFGILLALRWIWRTVRSPEHAAHKIATRIHTSINWPLIFACLFTLSPWAIRNMVVIGRSLLTTTHGGYTLLLANNPVFYEEVVSQPWGTVWQGDSLTSWQQSLEAAMLRENPPVRTELERNRWMFERAFKNIAEQPIMFIKASTQRFFRFWNIVPLGPSSAQLPTLLRWGIGIFYSLLFAGMLLGLIRLSRQKWIVDWLPVFLLIVSFSLVHFVFWTNTRMRVPITPAIALLAAQGARILHRPTDELHNPETT